MNYKLFLFSILLIITLQSFGQAKDTSVSQYKYYRPGIYLSQAGKLGTTKYVILGLGTLVALGASTSGAENKSTGPVILTVASVAYMVLDIIAWDKIKKAGLATEERRTKLSLYVAPSGFKVCYRF
jgi:hypothetical protein